MPANRRIFVGVAAAGLVIALVVVSQQRRNDTPGADVVDGSLPTNAAVDTAQTEFTAETPTAQRPVSASIPMPDGGPGDVCGPLRTVLGVVAEQWFSPENLLRDSGLDEESALAALEGSVPVLMGSPDPERFLTGFLMRDLMYGTEDDATHSASLLELGVRAANADSPMLAWHALAACERAEEYCPFPGLVEDLVEIDRDNADTWALAATRSYRRGDTAGALAAMQNAGQASASTMYWIETIAMAERALAGDIGIPFTVRAANAFNVAATNVVLDESRRMCREQAATSRAWAEACLAFGNVRVERNKTMLGKVLGFSLRELALPALGDTEGAAQVARELALFRYERTLSGSAYGAAMNLVTADPERFHAWLDIVDEFGEIAGGRRFAQREVPLFMQEAGLLEYEGARECAAQIFESPVPLGADSGTYRDYLIEDYPIQVGDQLYISVNGGAGLSGMHRIGPEGTVSMQRAPAIAVVGKTTAQIEQEIETALTEQRRLVNHAHVILMTTQSPEELRLEFDNALREAETRR